MQIGCNFHRRSEQLSHHNCPPGFSFHQQAVPAASALQRQESRAPHLNQPPRTGLVQLKWCAVSCKFQHLEYPRRLRHADRGQVCIFAANRRFRAVIQPPKIPVHWRGHVVPVPHIACQRVRAWPVCPLKNANLRGANPRPLNPSGAKGRRPPCIPRQAHPPATSVPCMHLAPGEPL